jgi:hypothetical protein
MRVLAAVLAAAVLAAVAPAEPADAGAWPRDPGEAFVSLEGAVETGRDGPDADASVYGEYGLSRRVTLVGRFTSADDRWTPSRAETGLRLAVGRLDGANRFAVSLGVSTPPDLAGMTTATRGEAGVHWGRGFGSRWGGGWATASARLLHGRDLSRPATDLFALVGLRPVPGWLAMVSGGRYEDDGGVYWKLGPAVGRELRAGLWLVPSLTQELSDDRSTRVGLALWITFRPG